MNSVVDMIAYNKHAIRVWIAGLDTRSLPIDHMYVGTITRPYAVIHLTIRTAKGLVVSAAGSVYHGFETIAMKHVSAFGETSDGSVVGLRKAGRLRQFVQADVTVVFGHRTANFLRGNHRRV